MHLKDSSKVLIPLLIKVSHVFIYFVIIFSSICHKQRHLVKIPKQADAGELFFHMLETCFGSVDNVGALLSSKHQDFKSFFDRSHDNYI